MTTGVPLDHVIARNLRELVEERGLTHRQFASWMQALGFDWTANRVAQTVTLRRSLGLSELAGVCNVLAVPLERLLAGEDEIVLSTTPATADRPTTTAPLAAIRAVLRDGEPASKPDVGRGWTAEQAVISVQLADELEDELARKLGIDTAHLRALASTLYGEEGLSAERDRRTGDLSEISAGTARVRRGHATRAILAEMRQQLAEWETKRKRRGSHDK